jgi:hypothetical protein
MNIADFVKENFDLIHKDSIAGSGMVGKELAKFKSTILGLDEFKGVETLNVLSSPAFRTYYNSKIRPEYIVRSEYERWIMTEKHCDSSRYRISYGIEHNIVNGEVRAEFKALSDDALTQCVNVRLVEENIFSNTVDLYAINVSKYYDFDDMKNVGEGIYFMPTIYNAETFNPIKEIRIKINPERRQDMNVINPNDGDEMMKRIYSHIDEKIGVANYCNIPTRFSILLRVSPRSLRPKNNKENNDSIKNRNYSIKIDKPEKDDINNYIFGR